MGKDEVYWIGLVVAVFMLSSGFLLLLIPEYTG